MPMSWATATARAPDGGRLIDHHQQAPVIGQLLLESTQALLVVGQGPVEDLPPVPAQGRGPVLALTDVDADEDVDVLDIHLSCRLSVKSIRGQPVDNRSRTHACERPLPFCGGSFPLSAVTSARLPQVTFAPGSLEDRGKTPMPTAAGPAPAPTARDHQQGNG